MQKKKKKTFTQRQMVLLLARNGVESAVSWYSV